MIVEYKNGLKFELFDDFAIIYFPEEYWVGSWGSMLDLVRHKIISHVKYILIDYSNVKFIGDGSFESAILREEFQQLGGSDVIHISVPECIKNLWKLADPKNEVKPFPEFMSKENALKYITLNHRKN